MAAPDPSLLLYEARACLRNGDIGRAEALYAKVLARAPGQREALLALGRLAQGANRLPEAVDYYRRAVAADRKAPESYAVLGHALLALGRNDEAESSFRRALALRPEYAQGHYLLGGAYYRQDRLDEAETCFRRALALKPDYADAYSDLGAVLAQRGKLDDAIACCRQALAIQPDYAPAHNNLGGMLRQKGQLAEALASFERAIALDPGYSAAHANRAWLLLAFGRFEEAWGEHEWRIRALYGYTYPADPRVPERSLPLPSTLLPIDFAGKRVLTVRDEGLGDELFFLRYAPLVKQRGARIAHLASAKLVSILRRVPEIEQVLTDEDALADFDPILLVGDLPLVLGGIGAHAIPPPLALAALPERVLAARQQLAAKGSGPYLGVAWRAGVQGRAGGRATFHKEVPLSLLAEAVRGWRGDVAVVQRAPRPGEIAAFSTALGRPVHDLSAANDSLEDMLGLLAVLDDCATVSNTNVHLRAGLGRSARILVPHPPEWRWMAAGAATPWLPGFSVYRESREEGWRPALLKLAQDLAAAQDNAARASSGPP